MQNFDSVKDSDFIYVAYEARNGTIMYEIVRARYTEVPSELLSESEFLLYKRKNFFAGRSITSKK